LSIADDKLVINNIKVMPSKRATPVARVQSTPNAPLRLSYLIARTDRVLNQHLAECLKPQGLNVPQYTALSILGRRSGLSNAQLARRTYISPQGMNQVLDQLTQAKAHRMGVCWRWD
jgi:hypothetical protein